uniref:Uncharacterized protein n=1 Tax=Arundo donax TaxID=35708 RepID=A0A0A9F0K6_ARUDO
MDFLTMPGAHVSYVFCQNKFESYMLTSIDELR